ncbi:MAG: 6-phosphogluconolactonase [Acidobacteriota bacterium]|jgi:6-phosphogluconolactonase|nr:6-phosphogluconolactonase [Acidobacteriota bacterium]
MLSETTTRRDFLKTLGLGAFGLTLARSSRAYSSQRRESRQLLVYVGTYTSGNSEGIYLYRLDLSSGALSQVGTTKDVVNPSYLALDARRRYLYAVNEVDEFAGRKSGAISAFAVDQQTGALRFLNQQPSLGGSPCYVSLDKSEKFVLVANYVGGNVSVFPVRSDGSLGEAADMKQDQGSGVNKERQEGPHAHCILPDQSGRHVYACDLGTDRIMIYRFDSQAGKLTPNEQPWVQVTAGAGPRHLTFHPGGKYAYVMNELNSTVTAFAHDSAQGTLKELPSISALPEDFKGQNTGADIHLSPDGKFLYCSNRGHDSIAAFGVDAASSRLSFIAHTPTGGKTPRNFAIDPTGNFLLVANQNSDTIVIFRRDAQTGKLQPTGNVAEVPSPVCLKLIAPFV